MLKQVFRFCLSLKLQIGEGIVDFFTGNRNSVIDLALTQSRNDNLFTNSFSKFLIIKSIFFENLFELT